MTAVRLLDEDAGLAERLSGEREAQARAALVARVLSLEEGPWTPDETPREAALGLLVLGGVLRRDVFLDESSKSVELLGQGDIVRPGYEDPLGSLPTQVEWSALTPVTLAILDARVATEVSRFPEVVVELVDRAVSRSLRHSVKEAIIAAPRVESRLIATLWSLADRWGRVTPDGVVLRLPLTHRLLAEMVGARRPSVTTGLNRLRERGVLAPHPEGLSLYGEPPVEPSDFRRPEAARD